MFSTSPTKRKSIDEAVLDPSPATDENDNDREMETPVTKKPNDKGNKGNSLKKKLPVPPS